MRINKPYEQSLLYEKSFSKSLIVKKKDKKQEKKHNKTIHHSTKMTPIEASKKITEKTAFSNLQSKRKNCKLQFQFGQIFWKADTEKVFSKGDMTKKTNIRIP